LNARLCKQFTFHAAHQLPNHDGACRNLHGHTYEVEVHARGHVSTEEGSPSEGMVVDFSVLKKVYREHIEPLVEHQNLNDTLPVPVTTAENIAGWMYSIFHDAMPQVMAVRVWETRTSWAEVSNGDAIRP
jgi:6-pyruvoyltetrahydropterin/6-carboxytetrahydropterin synthase